MKQPDKLIPAKPPLLVGREYYVWGGQFHPEHYDRIEWPVLKYRTKYLVNDFVRWMRERKLFDKIDDCPVPKCHGQLEFVDVTTQKCVRCKQIAKVWTT